MLRCALNSVASAAALLFAFSAVSQTSRHAVVARHVPGIVLSGQAVRQGQLAGEEVLELSINLPNRDEAGVDAELADLYNPASSNYHHWLTPQEVDLRFGPTREQFNALLDWARENGMTVTSQADNGRIVTVQAPVSVVNRALHVTMVKYHDTSLDRDFHAPDREPTTDLAFDLLSVDGLENSAPVGSRLSKGPGISLPSSISEPVTSSGPVSVRSGAITSLETVSALGGAVTTSGPVVARSGTLAPVKPNAGGSGPAGLFLPSDFRAAYYGTGNLTGAGQYVAIFSYDGYLTSDLSVYYQGLGLPVSTVPVTNVPVSNYPGGCYAANGGTTGTCADGEQILDIAQVQGMAPGLAGIRFYEATAANGNVALNQIYTDNIAKTVSSSWFGGAFGTASDTYFKNMAMVGMTYFNASGDDGAFNRSTYGAPAASAYIVQVGGTNLTTSGAGGAWSSEIAWKYSGGGFYSSAGEAAPTWQTQAGVITAANAGSTTYRNSPDIAAEANYDNPTAINGAFTEGWGGTSFATPRMAGYFALANQQAVLNGNTAGLGFINSSLYTAGLAQLGGGTAYYHDIVSGSNPSTAGTSTTYYTTTGYDLVTGWGSPNGTALLNYFAGSPVPDFGLPASVTVSFVRDTAAQNGGNYQRVSIPITAYNGYTGTVQISSLAGLPSGWSDGTVNGTPSSPFVLGLDIPSTTVPGNYTLTLTLADTSNSSMSHSVPVIVTVEKRANGDFTMSTAGATVPLSSVGSASILVTPGSGLSDVVNMAVTSAPVGITASFFNPIVPEQTATNVPLTIIVPGSITPGTYTIVVTGSDAQGLSHSLSVPLTVSVPNNALVNGGFETGSLAPWTRYTSCNSGSPETFAPGSFMPPQSGSYFALILGVSAACTQTMTQTFTIPSTGSRATLGFWQLTFTGQTTTTTVIDTLTTSITDASGASHTLGTLSNLNSGIYYSWSAYDLTPYMGQTVTLTFTGVQAGTTYTEFLLDNMSVFNQ